MSTMRGPRPDEPPRVSLAKHPIGAAAPELASRLGAAATAMLMATALVGFMLGGAFTVGVAEAFGRLGDGAQAAVSGRQTPRAYPYALGTFGVAVAWFAMGTGRRARRVLIVVAAVWLLLLGVAVSVMPRPTGAGVHNPVPSEVLLAVATTAMVGSVSLFALSVRALIRRRRSES